MAEVSEAASTPWLQHEATVDKGTSAELVINQNSTSPTSTVDTSFSSHPPTGSQCPQGLAQSMGSQGSDRERKERVSKEPSLAATSSREQRCSDPDRLASSFVVVPSVIRVAPLVPEKDTAEISDRSSARVVPVVRPFAVKKSLQTLNAGGELDPERVTTQLHKSEASGTQDEKGSVQQQITPSRKGVDSSDNPTSNADEVKRRHEAQVSFPTHNPQEQLTPTAGRRAGVPQMNGPPQSPPPPGQHVHYRQQHPNRQDAHGRATSVTSSVDLTPTLTSRRVQQRNMSSGSDAEMSPAIASTPLFQRLVTEEVQELKHYTRIIEQQNFRLNEVENITVDLDRKLQKQTKARTDLERTLELRERQWADKFAKLEADRDHWKDVVEQEKRMNTRLNDQVARMEQEIHRMLQRKYDHQRGDIAGSVRSSIRPHHNAGRSSSPLPTFSNKNSPSSPAAGHHGGEQKKKEQLTSPREILKNEGSVEVVRQRNVSESLFDFFGM